MGDAGLDAEWLETTDRHAVQLQQLDAAPRGEGLGLHQPDGRVGDPHRRQDKRAERGVAHHAHLAVQDTQVVQWREHVVGQLLDLHPVQCYLHIQ